MGDGLKIDGPAGSTPAAAGSTPAVAAVQADSPLAKFVQPRPSSDVEVGANSPAENPGYGKGSLLKIVPPELFDSADSFDRGLATRIDPEGWRNLLRQVWPIDQIAALDKDADKKAEVIIGQLTTRNRLASQLGQTHAVLMSVNLRNPEEVVHPDGFRVEGMLDPEQLRGAPKKVWDHAVLGSAGYPDDCQPTLDYWNNGYWDGYNIVAHFNHSTKINRVPIEQLADAAINQIPIRAVMETLAGRVFSPVLSFRDGSDEFIEKDYAKYPEGSEKYTPGVVKPYMLKGPAKEVWDFCVKQGLEPTLEYWDTFGANKEQVCGFDIVIHWFSSKDHATSEEKAYKESRTTVAPPPAATV